jgi:hypothetical protein
MPTIFIAQDCTSPHISKGGTLNLDVSPLLTRGLVHSSSVKFLDRDIVKPPADGVDVHERQRMIVRPVG